MSGLRRYAAALVVACLLTACGSGERKSILDSDARVPDDEGVVTKVNRKQVTIDNRKTYRFNLEVESFRSLEGHEAIAVIHLSNTYVHVGLDDDEVVWIAGIGLAATGQPVFYTGVYERTEDGRAVFADGTTLALGARVKVPKKGSRVIVQIDPKKHAITSMQTQ